MSVTVDIIQSLCLIALGLTIHPGSAVTGVRVPGQPRRGISRVSPAAWGGQYGPGAHPGPPVAPRYLPWPGRAYPGGGAPAPARRGQP